MNDHRIAASIMWALTSMGSCIAGFVHWSIPYLQWTALVVSIAAGLRSWRLSKPRK